MFIGTIKFKTGQQPGLPKVIHVGFGPEHSVLLTLADGLSLVMAIRDVIKPHASRGGLKTMIIDIDGWAEEFGTLEALKLCARVCDLGKLAIDRAPVISEIDARNKPLISTQPRRPPREAA